MGIGAVTEARCGFPAPESAVATMGTGVEGATIAAVKPTETQSKLCKLQYALGRVERCPEGGCPFWEPGGAVLGGRCAIERLDLADRPEVADWLIRVRRRLETAKSADDEKDARSLFYRLLNTGDADGG
jgi:hypothetical protein